MTMQQTERMGTEKVSRLLIRMAVPAVIAQIVNLLYNIVDRIYIGHIPEIGVPALTGVGLFTPVLMLLMAFSMFIGSGGAPLASIALGKRDNQRADRIAGVCFFGLIALSVLLTVGLLLFAPQLLRFFGASDTTLPYALEYGRIYISGTIVVMVTLGMNPFISGQGFAGTAMLTTVIGAAINIILDPLLIFTFHMGVRGAAIATVLSQTVSALWIILFLSGRQTTIRLQRCHIRPDWPILSQCMALGVSSLIMMGTEALLSVIFNRSLSAYGGDMAVGAMTIITGVNAVIFMPLQGVTQGAQPIMSYNYGAHEYQRVKDVFRLALIVNIMYSLICWALVRFAAPAIAGIFTNDPALIAEGVKIYEYTPGFVHAKVFVSDDVKAVVGTINLDYRSLYHHFECAAYLYRVSCLPEIEKDFQDTLSKCRSVTPETIRKEKIGYKIGGVLMKFIAPLM